MLKKAKARVLTRQQQSRRQSEVVPARRSKTTQSCPRDQHRLGNSPVVVHWRTSTRRRPDGWRAVQNSGYVFARAYRTATVREPVPNGLFQQPVKNQPGNRNVTLRSRFNRSLRL